MALRPEVSRAAAECAIMRARIQVLGLRFGTACNGQGDVMKVGTAFEVAAIGAVPSRNQWQMRMFGGPIYSGGVSFSADVLWGSVLLCRLVYAGPARTVAEAHAALAARGLIWIAGYESRPGGAMPTWTAPEPVCPSLG
ncbi:hypothetical protein [Variovorax boronicumulans]|nr:hypothetical protein [Variovorax boronicumulans]